MVSDVDEMEAKETSESLTKTGELEERVSEAMVDLSTDFENLVEVELRRFFEVRRRFHEQLKKIKGVGRLDIIPNFFYFVYDLYKFDYPIVDIVEYGRRALGVDLSVMTFYDIISVMANIEKLGIAYIDEEKRGDISYLIAFYGTSTSLARKQFINEMVLRAIFSLVSKERDIVENAYYTILFLRANPILFTPYEQALLDIYTNYISFFYHLRKKGYYKTAGKRLLLYNPHAHSFFAELLYMDRRNLEQAIELRAEIPRSVEKEAKQHYKTLLKNKNVYSLLYLINNALLSETSMQRIESIVESKIGHIANSIITTMLQLGELRRKPTIREYERMDEFIEYLGGREELIEEIRGLEAKVMRTEEGGEE